MPLYEFRCNVCGNRFELLLNLNEFKNSKILCNKCKSEDVTLLISNINFTLKGSGWYKDGYVKK